jgi:hypothetical protein
MEGWRQGRLGAKEGHSTSKGNYKTDLTLTGLLMEGLAQLGHPIAGSGGFRSIKQAISYCGLCGAEKSSADKVIRMPISKQRNKHIPQVLVEAIAFRLASCLSGRGESMPENEHPRHPCQGCFAQSRDRLTRRASRSCRGCIPTWPPPPLPCPAQGPSETPCHPG